MKLEKAIEILSSNGLKPEGTTWVEFLVAVQLLIEAGKRIEQERALHTYPVYKLLPGED